MSDNQDKSKYIQELEFHSKLLKRAEQIAGLGHWRIDVSDNNELFWSDEIYNIHGVDKQSFVPSVERAIDFYHPDDLPKVQRLVQDALDKGEGYSFDVRIVRPDGEVRYVLSSGECEHDKDGNVIAVFGVFHDVTDYKIREQEAKQAQEDLERIIETIPDLVFVKDSEFRIVKANKAFLNIYPEAQRDKVIGYAASEREYDEDDARSFFQQDRMALDGECVETMEEVRFPNGHSGAFLTKKVGYHDDQGNRFVLCVSRDLSDLVDIQKRLAESNTELEHFAYLASHDLQEPLRTVKNFSNLLMEEYSGKLDATAHQYIDFSVKAADRMQNLINDLLEYSRLDIGQEALEKVDLNIHLTAALENLKQSIEQIDAKVTFDELPIIQANPLCMTSLFQNLIGNALKYRKDNVVPEVHIGVLDEKHRWVFSVSDNGIGIKEEYLSKIFGIFQRLHANDKFSGTGIGLAVCQKIVGKMGGEIWIESVEGEGSTFYFTVPKTEKA